MGNPNSWFNEETGREEDVIYDEDEATEAYERERQEEEARAEAERLRAVFRRVLKGSAEGREVADYIIRKVCKGETSCFSKDALEMARNAGKQEIALWLKAVLED